MMRSKGWWRTGQRAVSQAQSHGSSRGLSAPEQGIAIIDASFSRPIMVSSLSVNGVNEICCM
ncbi:MAG TPA: hypothetical protein VJI75_04745 [Candidatus Nanoarchaeia archaeon]|nr:hypothetical protein [Candidatus Nanoarchaeia archaeon]